MGYETLNYLHDGTELPYFQRKEETEQKENEQKSNSNNKNNNDNKSQQNGGDNKSQNKANGSALNKQSQSQSSSQKLKGGPSDNKNKANGNGNNEQKSDPNNANEEDRISFDNIPLIIFSKTGESHIIDVQLKELGNKLREGLISVDRSLDDNVANLNKGTPDTTIRPIYIAYANDLIAYRFSANDLNHQFRVVSLSIMFKLYSIISECKDE